MTLAPALTPPAVLSMEEYQLHWQPQGWRLIVIGPTSTWRQEWGEWEAIRDIVQNALDEAESYQWGYDNQGLWIADSGRGLGVADFLLGPPKLKPDWARGKYGEGLKIAGLALLRQGYRIQVKTRGRELWLVFLEQQVDRSSVQTLAALWRSNGIASGSRFHIIGYHGDSFADRFAVNLPQESILFQAPSPVTTPVQRYNQLIRHEFSDGRSCLYTRDVYMRDIDSPFSYNLWGFEPAPDRFEPKNDNDLWTDIGRLWCCVDDVDLLETFFRMIRIPEDIPSEEGYCLNMDSYSLGRDPETSRSYANRVQENAPAWREAWRRVFGENAVIRTSDRWDATVSHLGYVSVGVQWYTQETLARAITTDKDLVTASQERLREAEVIPDEKLSPKHLAHLQLARAIAEAVFPYNRVGGVHAALIPPASDRVRTAGMYSRTTKEIYIALDQLRNAQAEVDTVIHELAHHHSGAEDGQEEHNAAMTKVAAKVVQQAANSSLDIYLEKVAW